MAEDCGARVRDWVDLVRRARLGKTVKYVAFALAQYADPDGTRIFPGIGRLAVECELSYNTVKAALGSLRTFELVEVVRPSRRRGHADEYRLIIGPNVMELLEVPSPAATSVAIEKLSASHRRAYKPVQKPDVQPTARAVQPDGHSSESGQKAVDNSVAATDVQPTARAVANLCTAHPTGCEDVCTARPTVFVQPVPRPPTSHYQNTTTTSHKTDEVRTAVTHSRASPPENPDSTRLPERCQHGIRARFRPDGTSSCALCRIADAIAPTGATA